MEKPSIGRIVHYVATDQNGVLVHRAAIITKVIMPFINLTCFPDIEDNPESAIPATRHNHVIFDPTHMFINSWHWPERI